MKALLRLTELYSHLNIVYDPLLNSRVNRWSLSLPGAGCQWAKECGGSGCTMCALPDAAHQFSRGYLLPSAVFKALLKLAYSQIQKKSPDVLAVYNGGSFLCDAEIPTKFQSWLCRWAAENKTVQKIFVEARAEHISTPKTTKMLRQLAGKTLQIGIGLEVADQRIRNTVINKGMTNAVFEKAVETTKLFGAQVLAYVLLKPIGMTEREAIEEAIKTAEYAFSLGVDIVALESTLVHPNTPVAALYKRGVYSPPKLWSLIEALQQIHKLGPVWLGNFDWDDDLPYPLAVPENCPKCTPLIRETLHRYRREGDIEPLSKLECECKTKH
jgi:radical SAM enzyme (TIGR01210 family)